MTSANDFFVTSNSAFSISEEEYKKADTVIKSFEAISRMTYQSLYIIDYFKKDFLFVSENPLFLRGHSPDEIKKLGSLFYTHYVPEKEQRMLMEINESGLDYFHEVSVEERLLYTISYDFHIRKGKRKVLINHKLTPVVLDKEGKIWLVACMVSLSARNSAGHIEMRKAGQKDYWTYSPGQRKWQECEGIALSEKEKDILTLSAQGYTMNEIADELYIAVDTVKYYKRRIFERMDVKNISAALSFATNYKLL